MSDLVNSAPGQCRLQVDSTSQISLQRYQGAYLPMKIGGTWEAKLIPSSAPTLANTGLTAGTKYNIYAFDSGGTLTLEASTTGHTADTDTGVEIKSGDASRTFLGAAILGAGTPGTFVGKDTVSFFNPLQRAARIFASFADAPTTGTSAETLYTYTLPGGTLAADGDALRITVACSLAANANNKSIVLNFGATSIVGTGQAAFNNILAFLVCDVVRVSATSQKVGARLHFTNPVAVSALGGANSIPASTTGNHSYTTPGETLANDIVIAFRALTPSAAGDVTGRYMFVDKYAAGA